MSRASLHRPRRPRVVWDRPATGTRLFTLPLSTQHPPTLPPLQALPQGPSPPPQQRSITVPPGPRDPPWKVPGQKTACPFQGLNAKCALHSPGAPPSPSRAAPTSTASSCSPGPLCPETPPSLPSERPCHTATAESPRPHISVWLGTSGGRDCPTPRSPRVSSTSSQKHGAVAEPASMWNIRCCGQHPSVQASPSSCATVRDLPPRLSPSPAGVVREPPHTHLQPAKETTR